MAKPTEQTTGSTGAARWFAVSLLALLGTTGIVRGFWQPPDSIAPVFELGPSALASRQAGGTVPDGSGHARTIDVNAASAAELDLLPGIGPVLAGRIIEFRETHGPFGGIDDLDAVRGIGPRTIARLAPFASAG